jgi:hypothetical protein
MFQRMSAACDETNTALPISRLLRPTKTSYRSCPMTRIE